MWLKDEIIVGSTTLLANKATNALYASRQHCVCQYIVRYNRAPNQCLQSLHAAMRHTCISLCDKCGRAPVGMQQFTCELNMRMCKGVCWRHLYCVKFRSTCNLQQSEILNDMEKGAMLTLNYVCQPQMPVQTSNE